MDIGGGSIQISLFDKDKLVSTQNMKLGVLRLQERLRHMNAGAKQSDDLITELVDSQMLTYKKLYLKDREIRNIIIVDDYVSMLLRKKSCLKSLKKPIIRSAQESWQRNGMFRKRICQCSIFP